MQTITLKDIIRANTIIEFTNDDERAEILNTCAVLGLPRLPNDKPDKHYIQSKHNAILITKHGVIETFIAKYVVEIRHTRELAYYKVKDHL